MPESAIDEAFRPFVRLATALSDNTNARPYATQLRSFVENLVSQARVHISTHALPERDFLDALYAVVAYFDELLLTHYVGDEWRPAALTLHYFEDNNAGVGFFSRLEKLIVEERWHVLRIYYYMLGLGFAGQYATNGDNAGLEAQRQRLRKLLAISAGLPQLPAAEARLRHRAPAWYAWMPLAACSAAMLVVLVVLAVRS